MENLTPKLEHCDWSAMPVPVDDGAADHLAGLRLPSVTLSATGGGTVDLSVLPGLSVVYVYPMTGQPNVALPMGWDQIPGARGCTPQSCSFRDHAAELAGLGVDHLFGLSTQDTAYQQEAADRLHLPFPLLSDHAFCWADALKLPRFETAGKTLLRRVTLIVRDGVIVHSLYPVFPPDQNAAKVIAWLRTPG